MGGLHQYWGGGCTGGVQSCTGEMWGCLWGAARRCPELRCALQQLHVRAALELHRERGAALRILGGCKRRPHRGCAVAARSEGAAPAASVLACGGCTRAIPAPGAAARREAAAPALPAGAARTPQLHSHPAQGPSAAGRGLPAAAPRAGQGGACLPSRPIPSRPAAPVPPRTVPSRPPPPGPARRGSAAAGGAAFGVAALGRAVFGAPGGAARTRTGTGSARLGSAEAPRIYAAVSGGSRAGWSGSWRPASWCSCCPP